MAPAAAAAELERPRSQSKPPPGFERSAVKAIAISGRAEKVVAERRKGPIRPVAYMKGATRWQVSWFRDDDQVVQVLINDRSGALLEQWRGPQVAWTMARGYDGAFGRKLNAPYVWIPLCVLFVLPFVDPRRPFRLLHLDLLVLLGFGVSHIFFNRGEIGLSVPLVYPVLLYLLVRMLLVALRPGSRPGRLLPLVPVRWLLVGVAFLAAFRIGLNLVDSNVIDVGYAGVIGADRIADGDPLYGQGFSERVGHGDTYGPLTYVLYLPFEQALPWSGAWDKLWAAHAAAIAFDLLALGGLFAVGRRLRPGSEGRALAAALAWAWVAYPYTSFALQSNSNDILVALFCVVALLAVTMGGGAIARAVAIGLAAATKFAPLALAPLFASRGGRRSLLVYGACLGAVLAVVALPFLPDGGLRELYDRTIGYQAGRDSPFSVWGQEPSLAWLQTGVEIAAVAFALFVPLAVRRPSPHQLAALGAAVLIVVQLAVGHWFYLYVVWLAPFVLVAVLGTERRVEETPELPPARTRELVPA